MLGASTDGAVAFLTDMNADNLSGRSAGDSLARLATLAKAFDHSTSNISSNNTPNHQHKSPSSSYTMNVDLTAVLRHKRSLEASMTRETSSPSNEQRQQQQPELQTQFVRQTPLTAEQLAMLTGGLTQHIHQQLQESAKRQRLMDEARHRHPQVDGDYEETDDAGDDESHEDEDGQATHGIRFREYQAEIWSEKFEELCAFRRVHQHCHVPHLYADNASLAQWVKRQRYQFKLKLEGKHSTLSDERIRMLNTIGFVWNSHDAVWEERVQDLLHFKRSHGHCIVPSNYEPNIQLAVWTKRQRRQYKNYQEGNASSMTSDRIAKLEQMGFVWDCRNSKTASTRDKNNLVDESSWPRLSVPKNHQDEGGPAAGTRNNHSLNTTTPKDNYDINGAGQGSRKNKMTAMGRFTASGSSSETLYHQIMMMTTLTKNAAAPALSQQTELSKQPQHRMPKCEFFSFSRSYTASKNKNTAV